MPLLITKVWSRSGDCRASGPGQKQIKFALRLQKNGRMIIQNLHAGAYACHTLQIYDQYSEGDDKVVAHLDIAAKANATICEESATSEYMKVYCVTTNGVTDSYTSVTILQNFHGPCCRYE